MEMMTDITLVAAEVLALFCMMLVGVAARLAGILTKDSTRLLSSLLVNVTQPLMILTSMQISYTQERLRTGLFIALLSAGFHVLLSVVARLIYGKVKNSRVMEFGTVFANCAYLGFPVLTVIFGEEGLFYGAFFTLFLQYIHTHIRHIPAHARRKKQPFQGVCQPRHRSLGHRHTPFRVFRLSSRSDIHGLFRGR